MSLAVSFAHPSLLLLLLLIPAGAVIVSRAEQWRRAALARFGNPELLASLSAIPDVLVVLDLSRSMNVTDAGATRLARAKQLLGELAAARPADRLGLIVFGGSAFLQLPLTTDHDAFRRFVEAGSTDDIGDPSTDLSAALAAAGTTFEHAGEPGSRAVVVVSDGESGEGDIPAGLVQLVREAVPVFAVGVGSVAGGPVPADSSEAPEPYHRDNIGRVVVSRLEEADLRQAAERTGGLYARWDDADALRALEDGLARVATRPLAALSARKPAEQFQWPLALVVLVLAMERLVPLAAPRRIDAAGVPARLGSRAAAVLAVLGIMLVACSPTGWQARRAERRYDAGDWAGAYTEWNRAHQSSGNPAFAFDAGNALYRQKHYGEATARWREAMSREQLRQHSNYNRGNAAIRAAEDATGLEKDSLLDGAVSSFEEALRLDPTDGDAKWNLEIALRRRGERPGGSSSGRSRHGDYGQGNQNVPGFQGNPEAATGAMAGGGFGSGADGESVKELDPTQARQLLDAVQREQLASHLGRRASHPTREAKDW